MKRMENPRIVPLIWYREAWEEQEEIAGTDPWEYGPTERNLHNMNTLAGYCHEQGLTRSKFDFRRPVRQRLPGPQARRRIPLLTADETGVLTPGWAYP